MPITVTQEGTADSDAIRRINIVRKSSGDLTVEVFCNVGPNLKNLRKFTASAEFKASIEETYAEIVAAINTAEGLS